MEVPTVRYAKTSDGVSIAYGVIGEGEPLLYCRCPAGPPFTAVVPTPELDPWFGELARRYQLITFDFRGGGLSERGDRELTFEAIALDMLAILDDLGLQSANIQTELMSSAAAVYLAARHPDRVRRLVLWHPMIAKSQRSVDPRLAARWDKMFASAEDDWEMFAVRLLSESYEVPGEVTRRIARAYTDTTNVADFVEAWDPRKTDDAGPLLASVAAPTLVLHRDRDGYYSTLLDGAQIASQIPGASLCPVPGMENFPYTDHPEAIVAEVERFLGNGLPVEVEGARQRGLPPDGNGRRNGNAPLDSQSLSKRETEVLLLVAQGRTNARIAEQLGVEASTIARHVHNLLTKTGLANRTELADFAHRAGLVAVEHHSN